MRAGNALALCLAVTVAVVGGCGRGDAEDEARAVAERLYAAVDEGDGRVACEALSEDTRSELEQQERKPCAEAVLGLELSGRRASDTTVTVTSARVDLEHGDSVFLDETDEGWRVSAAGCKPTAEEQPYDCELEA